MGVTGSCGFLWISSTCAAGCGRTLRCWKVLNFNCLYRQKALRVCRITSFLAKAVSLHRQHVKNFRHSHWIKQQVKADSSLWTYDSSRVMGASLPTYSFYFATLANCFLWDNCFVVLSRVFMPTAFRRAVGAVQLRRWRSVCVVMCKHRGKKRTFFLAVVNASNTFVHQTNSWSLYPIYCIARTMTPIYCIVLANSPVCLPGNVFPNQPFITLPCLSPPPSLFITLPTSGGGQFVT